MNTEVKGYDFSDFDFSEISSIILHPNGSFVVKYSNGEVDRYNESDYLDSEV